MKNFQILSIKVSPGGPGPDRIWDVQYKAYVKKKWKHGTLHIIARNQIQAEYLANKRFGQ